MTTSSFAIDGIGKLTMLEVYAYFDKPTLFACQSLSGQIYLSLWIEDTLDSSRWFYLPISEKRLTEVKSGNLSLRDAFSDPEDSWLWEIQISLNREQIYKIDPAKIDSDDLPEKDAFLNYAVPTLPTLKDNPTVIAQQIKRDIVNISLEPSESHKNEIDAEHLGLILVRTQSLLNSLPQKNKSLKGRVPKKFEEATALKVVGFYAASFGIRLESKNYGDLFGETGASKSLELFSALLNVKSDKDKLTSLLETLSPKSLSRYRFLLRALRDTETSLKFEWSSPNEKYASAHVSLDDIKNTLDVLFTKELNTSDLFEIRGTLIAINVKRNSFAFKTIDGDTISGIIDPSLNGTVFNVPAEVKVEIEETLEISQTTQEEKTSYKLLKVLDN